MPPAPLRVVSLCPSNTEIVAALGATAWLIGLDRSSDWPEEIRDLPRVGPDLSVDVEAIARLEPDIVLSSLSVPGMERNVEAIDRAGLRQIVLDPRSLAGVYESLLLAGRALGLGLRAAEVVAQMQGRLDAIAASARALPRPRRVFLEWWPKPVIVPGRQCWTAEMIALAGGESLFADRDVRSVPVEEGEIPARDPELLLTCWCGVPHERQRPDKLPARPGWSGISGVRAGQVFAAEERYFGRPGPRLVEGVAWLHDRIRASWGAPEVA